MPRVPSKQEAATNGAPVALRPVQPKFVEVTIRIPIVESAGASDASTNVRLKFHRQYRPLFSRMVGIVRGLRACEAKSRMTNKSIAGTTDAVAWLIEEIDAELAKVV